MVPVVEPDHTGHPAAPPLELGERGGRGSACLPASGAGPGDMPDHLADNARMGDHGHARARVRPRQASERPQTPGPELPVALATRPPEAVVLLAQVHGPEPGDLTAHGVERPPVEPATIDL